MNKKLITLLLGITMLGSVLAADFTSFQLASSTLTNGYILQTNGKNNRWVATSSLGITSGGGWTFSSSTIWSLFSNTATGLTYNSGTGATSLTAGYVIPLLASTTQWATAYASTTNITPSWIRGLFSGTSPITLNGTTGAIGINKASSTADGYLSSTDWTTFNSKQPAGSYLTSAITSLNGLTGATQTFATSSDTNLGLTIVSGATTHTFTPTWIGTLADGRIASASTWNAKAPTANPTFTGLANFANATGTGLSATNVYANLFPTGLSNSLLAVDTNGKIVATTTTGGTTYTGTYPIIVSGSVISSGFSTSTVNTYSAQQTFQNASSSAFSSPLVYITGLASTFLAADQNGKIIATTTPTGTTFSSTTAFTVGRFFATTTMAVSGPSTFSSTTQHFGTNNAFTVSSTSVATVGRLFATTTATVSGPATFSSTTLHTGTSNLFAVASSSVHTIGTLFATSSATLATTTMAGPIVHRVVGYASNASTTINCQTTDQATTTIIRATTIVNFTCTPFDGQMVEITFMATTTQTLYWGTQFGSSTDFSAPSTMASGTMYTIHQYDRFRTKWWLVYLAKAFNN